MRLPWYGGQYVATYRILKQTDRPLLRSLLALDVRASRTDFQEAYRLIYPMGSKLTHATSGGMAMHADRNASSARIGVPPSLMLCKEALIPTHLCAVKMVETVSSVMAQEPSHSIASLAADYHHAWGAATQP